MMKRQKHQPFIIIIHCPATALPTPTGQTTLVANNQCI